MKVLIMFLILTLSLKGYCSGSDSLKYEQESNTYKEEILIKSSISLYTHFMGTIPLFMENVDKLDALNYCIIYNSVGLVFDIFIIIECNKYKKFKYENGKSKISYR